MPVKLHQTCLYIMVDCKMKIELKMGAIVISRVSGLYIKKGATFRRASLPFKKGAALFFYGLLFLWPIRSFCPLACSTPAGVKPKSL